MMPDALSKEAIEHAASEARRHLRWCESNREYIDSRGARAAKTVLALIGERERRDPDKTAADYAAHRTCQHGRDPNELCVPCSWAARIVEQDVEIAALRAEIERLRTTLDALCDASAHREAARVIGGG